MASLNLLQWRHRSVWRQYRGWHVLGLIGVLLVLFLSGHWVTAHQSYLSALQQRVTDQHARIERLRQRQALWKDYQVQQAHLTALKQRKRVDQHNIAALAAVLNNTQGTLVERELTYSPARLSLGAHYARIQNVNAHFQWLNAQLSVPIQQQLNPYQRVSFYANRLDREH